MQKCVVSQQELNEGTGQFDDYMKFVVQRLTSKETDPKIALFAAATIIADDGLVIRVGSEPDDAALNVSNWLNDFYGDRNKVSCCLPPLAYQLNGIAYLLRFPLIRPGQMLVTQAVIDLEESAASLISSKSLALLEETYNEFYDTLYQLCRLDTTTMAHLAAAAHNIYAGRAHYAQARWDSLFFVEFALKEVFRSAGIAVPKGSDGHDVRGTLHDMWVAAGKPALPRHLLDDVMCSTAMRYDTTPQPFLATMRAHHAAIRLGAMIAHELPALPTMGMEQSVDPKDFARDITHSLVCLMQSADPSVITGPHVRLLRPNA